MASPVSEAPVGRAQIPQPMRGQGFTTILCGDGKRNVPGPSSLGSPSARRGPPELEVGPGPRPADENQDLFWQLWARRAAAVRSMRLQRKWIWTGYSTSSSVVSAATVWSQLEPAVRQLRLSRANNSACNSSVQFIWLLHWTKCNFHNHADFCILLSRLFSYLEYPLNYLMPDLFLIVLVNFSDSAQNNS